MPIIDWRLSAALAICAFPTLAARADIDISVPNGQKVTGTLLDGDGAHVLRVTVPAGSLLSVTVKGKKSKADKSPPSVTFRVLDASDAEVPGSTPTPKGTGARLKKLPIAASGEYRVEITAATGDGDYLAAVKWKSPRKVSRDVVLDGEEVLVPFAVDRGAVCTFHAKAARGSEALPRLVAARQDDADVHVFPPAGEGASEHREKKIAFETTGDHVFAVDDAGAVGGAAVATVSIKPPKTEKRRVTLSAKQLSTADAIGAVIGPAGGAVEVTDPLTDLLGAGVEVSPLALSKPTAIVIGAGIDVAVEQGGDPLNPQGPAVFFGPEGLRFGGPVSITVPFSPFGGTEDDVLVAVRDARGRETLVPESDYTVDLDAGAVTVEVVHFSTYQVVSALDAPLFVVGDLDADGFEDLVVASAGDAYTSFNTRVDVFSGGSSVPAGLLRSDAVASIRSQSIQFGSTTAVGDVTGDMVSDLVVGAYYVDFAVGFVGATYVFAGGPDFAGDKAARADADVLLQPTTSGDLDGYCVTVGDLIGDATPDIAVSSRDDVLACRVYVYEGGPGLSSSSAPAVTLVSGGSPFILQMDTGDVNGDGFADLICEDFDGGDFVRVLFGPLPPGNGTLAAADASISGVSAGNEFVDSIAVGDVIGDDADDIVMRDFRGNRILIFAGGSGFASTTVEDADVVIDDDANGPIFDISIADIDGDARHDLILGAPGHDGAVTEQGALFVFRGGSTLASGVRTTADSVVLGNPGGESFGFRIATLDFDGDGLRDIAAALPDRSHTGPDGAGGVLLYRGRAPVSALSSAAPDLEIRGDDQGSLSGFSVGEN